MSKVLVRLSEQKQNDYRLLPLEDLIDILPHGSGFDGDWQIDTDNANYPNAIILSNGYHAMDGNGFYSGWLNFDIFIGKPGCYDPEDGGEMEAFDPAHWYHTFDIDYDDSDLDYDDDADRDFEDSFEDDDDNTFTECEILESYEFNGVNKESLIEYIDDTICNALQGILSATIVLESED